MANNTKRLKDQAHLFIGCPELPDGYYYRIRKETNPYSIFDYEISLMQKKRFKDFRVVSSWRRVSDYPDAKAMLLSAAEYLAQTVEFRVGREEKKAEFIRDIGF